MISSYRLFATTKAEIKQTGYDRLLCRSRVLTLYAGHPHPHQIDYPLHSPAALTGLPPIFYNPVLQHFGHPLRNGPDTTSARRMSVINRGSTLGWRSPSRPPADSAASVSTQCDLRTAHRGKGASVSGHLQPILAVLKSLSGGQPIRVQLGRLSRYVDPVQAGDVFTQYLLLDLQGHIHVVLLFQILRQPV